MTNAQFENQKRTVFDRERSGRVLDSRPRGLGFNPHRHHCVVSLSKKFNPSLVLVQSRKTHPFITEELLMGCKESNQRCFENLQHLPYNIFFVVFLLKIVHFS